MKKLPGIFAAIVILASMAMMAMQGEKIDQMQFYIDGVEEDLAVANDELKMSQELLAEAHLKIEELEAEIKRLNGVISNLDKEIEEYKESLKNLRGRISTLKGKVEDLTGQITQLQQEKNANWLKIDELIAQKEAAEAEIQSLRIKEQTIEEVKEEAEAEAQAEASLQVVRTQELNDLRTMLTRTIVNFEKVNLMKKPDGKMVKKVKYNDKSWKYTRIQFRLDNPNPELLKQYQYVVKILDLDTGMTIPHNENNPSYPEGANNTEGYVIDYDGNLADILYFNNTKKQSQNYEVRVYVRLDGKDLPLTKGKCPLVEHGKSINIQYGKPLSQ